MSALGFTKATVAALGLTIGLSMTPAFAAGGGEALEAFSVPASKSCPSIRWIVNRDGGTLKGYAMFTDLSGISKIAGTYDNSGKFTATLTSLKGNGPAGQAAGERDKFGSLVAKLTGTGCSNADVRIDRDPNYNMQPLG